jgi:hypothetical protein
VQNPLVFSERCAYNASYPRQCSFDPSASLAMPCVPHASLRHQDRAKIAAQSVMVNCPILDSFRDSRRRHSLASQGLRASPSRGTAHPFWDSYLQTATSGRRSPWLCTRSFTRARGLNPLIGKDFGLFANSVVSEACLWAVCKQCGLICCDGGSDVPPVCSECGLTSAFVCGPASG